jgi:hypothetical protein
MELDVEVVFRGLFVGFEEEGLIILIDDEEVVKTAFLCLFHSVSLNSK